MTIKELRDAIAESKNSEFLNSIEANIDYSYLNYSIKLKGLANFYQFTLEQVKGWNKVEKINLYLKDSKEHFEHIKYLIEDLKNHFNDFPNSSSFKEKHMLIIENLESQKLINNRYYVGQYKIFLYTSPEAKFLLDINEDEHPEQLKGAYNYIANEVEVIDNDYLTGLLKGYEFKNQDSSIIQRRNTEKISLGIIRQQFQEHISEAEAHLNDYLQNTKKNLIEHFDSNNKVRDENNTQFEEWHQKIQNSFNEFYEAAKSNINANEDLYKMKLKLEAPANYWKNRASDLKREGNKWSTLLFIAIGIGTISLFTLLWQIPDGIFLKLFEGEASAIKWTIVYVTFISFIAYSIKVLAKLTFSTFHLSRDAEEREQLSYFYLALRKDDAISNEERQLVLQSLFSRSDTGLLKEDSSPTMPTNIIEKHLK